MSATAVTLGQDISQPKFNPWLIAVIVSLAAFMEVLDTSIAIHRWQPRSKQRRKRLRAHLISRFERHRIADQRLTRGNARAQAVLHGMSVYFHRKFVSVWHHAETRGADTISGVAGHRRWRCSTHGTGDSSRYIPAPKTRLGLCPVRNHCSGRANDRPDARRMDYVQLFVALDFLHQYSCWDRHASSALSRFGRPPLPYAAARPEGEV